MLNSIEVRRSSYPQRRDYLQFFLDYRVCDDIAEKWSVIDKKINSLNAREGCEHLLRRIFLRGVSTNDVLFGREKVYMKIEFESELDAMRKRETVRKRTKQAVRIQ